MFDDSNSKVIWFIVALVAIGVVTGIIIAILTSNQEFVINELKRIENY